MKPSSKNCPCCNSTTRIVAHAFVAPFICEIAGIPNRSLSELRECANCGHRNYSMSYTQDECKKIYGNYREISYFSIRNKHEPWYSQKVNSGIGNDPIEVESRRLHLEKFLGEDKLGEIVSALDWGGDKGQFMPPGIPNRYVYEISNVKMIDGVTRIGALDSLRDLKIDLTLNCHVLEHYPEPIHAISELGSSNAKWYYFEVPFESYRIPNHYRGRKYKSYLKLIVKNKLTLRLIDFYTTAFRIFFKGAPPLGAIKQHEHIQFFTEKSLRCLIQKSGYTVLKTKIYSINSRSGLSRAISCLATRN